MAPAEIPGGVHIVVGSQSPTHTIVGGAMKSTETVRIAHTMMMAAIAHYTTSVYCLDAPQAKASSMGKYYFHIVAFELMLLSIEHSLKLTLFLETSSFPPKHNIVELYKQVVREANFYDNFQHKVFHGVNHHASSISLPHIEENSILRCLEKHDSSYMNFRYFGVKKDAQSVLQWEITAKEVHILYCLSITLLEINIDRCQEHGMPIPQPNGSVHEADTGESLRELMQRAREQFMGRQLTDAPGKDDS